MYQTMDLGNEEQGRRSSSIQHTTLQPWQKIPKKIVCGVLILLFLIAGIIVSGVISTYSSTENLNKSNSIFTSTIDVTYGTNLKDTDSLIIANPTTLSTNLMKQLDLTGIEVISAGFRRSSITRTNNNQGDNLFNIIFSIKHPSECHTTLCLKNFNSKVQSHIVNEHPQINLTITFTNGQTLTIQLHLYVLGKSSSAPVITGITRIAINPSTNSTAPSESPTFGGRIFGNVGMYEKLRGKAYGQLDPNDVHNRLITDLQLAPRNNDGMVEYSMDFYIFKPVNLSNGNHKLFFEVNNRGNKVWGSFSETAGGNNPSTASDAGRAFLLNQGYTIAWCGWDPSVAPIGSPDLLRIYLPIATNSDGSSITGPSYEYFSFGNSGSRAYRTSYNTSSTDTTKAKLTARYHLTDPPVMIPSTDWTWISNNTISLLPANNTFNQSWIYELVYTAKDPYVAGIGFATTRDFVSFLRSTRTDNPLEGDTTQVISWTVSQPARYMNDFIWLGFNEDLKGQHVFDGVFNWVGAGTGVGLNYRFAQSTRTERTRQDHLYPEGPFPFSYTTLTDPLTGKTDGRNRRCMETSTCPKIMNINSANEYWVKTGSLLHSDLEGNDLVDPPNVRNYLISGSQHAGPSPANSLGICQQFGNTIDPNPVLRALFVALEQWLDGTEPPASMVPRHSDGTAVLSNITMDSPLGIGTVSQTALNWPTIPNVLYTGLITDRNFFNFGPQFNEGIISIEPPNATGLYYPTFVSKVDIDGNELAGIRLPPVTVPFGTNAGWNLRLAAYGGNDGCEGSGSLIPFAPDKATRINKGDTRLSLTERYGNHSGYVAAVTTAVNALVNQRLLRSDDVQTYINAAQQLINVINNPVYGNYTW